MSVLLYGYSICTLTKRLEEKLNENYTRVLRAVLKKSWKQHPSKLQLYGYLPLIIQIILDEQDMLDTAGEAGTNLKAKFWMFSPQQRILWSALCRHWMSSRRQHATSDKDRWWERDTDIHTHEGIHAISTIWWLPWRFLKKIKLVLICVSNCCTYWNIRNHDFVLDYKNGQLFP